MIVKCRIWITAHAPDDWSRLVQVVRATDCPQDGLHEHGWPLPSWYTHEFDARDPRLYALRQALREQSIRWTEQSEHLYTAAELLRAPLIRISGGKHEIDVDDIPYLKQYDFSRACSRCGTAAIPIGPLVLNRYLGPRKRLLCQTSRLVFLVAPTLAEALLNAGLTSFELLPVRSSGGRQMSWRQLVPRFQLPPAAPTSRGLIRSETDPPCPACGRDGYFLATSEPLQLSYRPGDFPQDAIPDFASSFEHIGISRRRRPFSKSIFARPMMLISARTYRVLRRCGAAAGLRFEPIILQPESG